MRLILKIIKKIIKYFFQRIYFFFLLFTIKSLNKSDYRLVVSLRSQPSRIKNCWIAILSILNQDFQNYISSFQSRILLAKITMDIKSTPKKGVRNFMDNGKFKKLQ